MTKPKRRAGRATETERLDFMGEAPRELLCFYDGYAVGFTLDGTHATISKNLGAIKPTVRRAIDAAMRGRKPNV